jgi:DNA invertase Pin-like site-specific DNA recombinase
MSHGDLVRAGMARAVARGVHVGRPVILAEPSVAQNWPMVRRRIESGEISRREAARLLGVGEASVRRMLAARP